MATSLSTTRPGATRDSAWQSILIHRNECHHDAAVCATHSGMQGDRLVVQMRDLVVRIRERPFAAGGMRHCFRMWKSGQCKSSKRAVNLVGKQSK